MIIQLATNIQHVLCNKTTMPTSFIESMYYPSKHWTHTHTQKKPISTHKTKTTKVYMWDLRIRANTVDLAQFKVLDGVILLGSPKSKAFGSLYIPTTIGRWGIPLNLQLGIKILLRFQHCSVTTNNKNNKGRSSTLHSHGDFLSLEKQFSLSLSLSLKKPGEASPERSKRGEAPETLLAEKEKGEGNCANEWERWKSFGLGCDWNWGIENPRERSGTSHGEGNDDGDHSFIFSCLLSLSLCGYYGLNQEQGKQNTCHGNWEGNAYHYKSLLCNFMLFCCHCPLSNANSNIGFNSLTLLTAFPLIITNNVTILTPLYLE